MLIEKQELTFEEYCVEFIAINEEYDFLQLMIALSKNLLVFMIMLAIVV